MPMDSMGNPWLPHWHVLGLRLVTYRSRVLLTAHDAHASMEGLDFARPQQALAVLVTRPLLASQAGMPCLATHVIGWQGVILQRPLQASMQLLAACLPASVLLTWVVDPIGRELIKKEGGWVRRGSVRSVVGS